jgi:protein phosphatase
MMFSTLAAKAIRALESAGRSVGIAPKVADQKAEQQRESPDVTDDPGQEPVCLRGPDLDVRIDAQGISDVGKVRKVNEDQFLIASLKSVAVIGQTNVDGLDDLADDGNNTLFLVADGVGSGGAGQTASRLAIQTIVNCATSPKGCLRAVGEGMEDRLRCDLECAIRQSHRKVHAQAEREDAQHAMATTLTMAYVLWPKAYLVQVGDSRCYRLRGSRMEQVTRDQTMAQDLMEQGILPRERASDCKWAHVLSSAVGGSEIAPVISTVDLQVGDVLLLCTDGLTKHASDEEIAEHLSNAESAEAACQSLLSKALAGGGSDNVTMVVSRFV